MLPEVTNLNNTEGKPGTEAIEEIVSGEAFYLEQIVSRGDASEPDFWYDQKEAEWVVLISGQATLEFEEGILELRAGDSLTIEPHQPHRVVETSVDAVWIALHFIAEQS